MVEEVPADTQEMPAQEVAEEQVDEAQVMRDEALFVLQTLSPQLKAKYDQYFYDKIGGGHRKFFTKESDERKAARTKWKKAARNKAAQDLALAIGNDNPAAQQGEATRRYIEMLAETQLYDTAKESMEIGLKAAAEELTLRLFAPHMHSIGIINEYYPIEQWARDRGIKKQAEALKNSVIGKNQKKLIDGVLARMTASKVQTQVETDKVGKNALLKMTTECTTADEGMGIIGKALDKLVPDPGDMASLSVEIKVPVGPGQTVSVGVSGKAAKGIDGAMTPGVPVLGKKEHFELMGQVSVGVGFAFIGVEAGFKANFFARAGADSTPKAMKAFSYGAYRNLSGIVPPLASFLWSGKSKGAKVGHDERSEIWAAMVEETVFAEGEIAYADMGVEAAGEVAANVGKKVASAEAAVALAVYNHYDRDRIFETMGGKKNKAGEVIREGLIGQSPENAREAKRRQKMVSGKASVSFSVSGGLTVSVPGLSGLSFAGSISGSTNGDIGLEITATITKSSGGSEAFEQVITGVVNGLGSITKNLVGAAQKSEKGGNDAVDVIARSVNSISDAVDITDTIMKGEIGRLLNESLRVDVKKSISAFNIGDTKADIAGAPEPDMSVFQSDRSVQLAVLVDFKTAMRRIELRDISSKTIGTEVNGIGLTLNYEKSKRLGASEWVEGQEKKSEVMGTRL